MLEEPAYEAALLGEAFMTNGDDPNFDPLTDADGCLWASLASVLTDGLGLQSTDQLALMDELFELNETLWVEFDARWSSCMSSRGHPYLAVEDPYFEFVDVDRSAEEIATAQDDVECRGSVLSDPGYSDLWDRINAESERIGGLVRDG